MEMFHIQLALIAGLIAVSIYFFYSKKKVNQLSEELLDKKIVINELAQHASKIEKEINSVGEVKPIKKTKTKTDKVKKDLKEISKNTPKATKKVTKSKTEKVAKPKKVTKKTK